MKEKAWAIMEEKDAQLRAARVSILLYPSHTSHAGGATVPLHARSCRGNIRHPGRATERCIGFAG